MATQTFSKFVRPQEPRRGQISDRDLDIIDAVLRYRFSSASQLVRLVGGNEGVTHRRLRFLWERGLVNRWAFPGIRTHSEFYYYLDSREPLDLLAERRRMPLHEQMLEEVRNNREKGYAGAALRGQHMQLGFLQHWLMISRLHFMLELACRASQGAVELAAWRQGADLSGRRVQVPALKPIRVTANEYEWAEGEGQELLPLVPDALFTLRFSSRPENQQLAHFFYEADRGSMGRSSMLKKLRAFYHFIKRQQKHREAFGIHPVRAVLIETTDENRARRLAEMIEHPVVAGPAKRVGLFWLTISPVFDAYLKQPEAIFEPIWALPTRPDQYYSSRLPLPERQTQFPLQFLKGNLTDQQNAGVEPPACAPGASAQVRCPRTTPARQ